MGKSRKRDTTTVSTTIEHFVRGGNTRSQQDPQPGRAVGNNNGVSANADVNEIDIANPTVNDQEITEGIKVTQQITHERTRSRHGRRHHRHRDEDREERTPIANPVERIDAQLPAYSPSGNREQDLSDLTNLLDYLTIYQPDLKKTNRDPGQLAPTVINTGGYISARSPTPIMDDEFIKPSRLRDHKHKVDGDGANPPPPPSSSPPSAGISNADAEFDEDGEDTSYPLPDRPPV
ncbi:uncharacterized protein I303_108323 [Kwoniella dejecticola CBS 10117]|uniref:Uncharacterized protein n=1 Tax=Kwoniella dejecticola CBS 10117 TaxID=1296121 RepID=A0A1A5ZXR3_9TREE|nr:uncharacterized protein I303_07350 [Kwoniella dejecticola CBS 10117]OBR82588.1 hypothetical protein I303_07350 [Kwoniella dejecticola CBS 10117]